MCLCGAPALENTQSSYIYAASSSRWIPSVLRSIHHGEWEVKVSTVNFQNRFLLFSNKGEWTACINNTDESQKNYAEWIQTKREVFPLIYGDRSVGFPGAGRERGAGGMEGLQKCKLGNFERWHIRSLFWIVLINFMGI